MKTKKTMNLTPYKKVVLELESYSVETLIDKGRSKVAAETIKARGKEQAKKVRAWINSIEIVTKLLNKNK